MKTIKRLLALALASIFVLTLCPLTSFAKTVSGACGAEGYNLAWTLDTSTGTLTISGTGEMGNSSPWYSYEDSITSVIIEDGVTGIGQYAFYRCTNLTSVTIGNSVTSIGSSAFSGCTGLARVTIPDSVTNIGYNAFEGCTGIESVYITDIAAWCAIDFIVSSSNPLYYAYAGKLYLNNELVTDLVIPEGVTDIGDYAFDHCTGLKSVTIPDSVTSIGRVAFRHCTGLISVTIPDSVTSIGQYAFLGCTGLKSVTIPDGVNSIGSSAFSGCTSLESIIIPDSVTSIGGYTFFGCTGLTSVTIPDRVTSIGSFAFSDCTGLTSVIIPSSVTSICNQAFENCTGLKYNIYDNGKYLGNEENPYYALIESVSGDITSCEIHPTTKILSDSAFFAHADLTSIEIPDSVTGIGSSAFYNCTGLENIYCEADSQPSGWHENWLGNCTATIHWGHPCYGQHTPGDEATCTDNQTCTVCGELLEPARGHDDGEWITLTDGSKELRCTVCGEILDTQAAPVYATGDVNMDGEVDMFDYAIVKKVYFELPGFSLETYPLADVDGDGEVTPFDYLIVKKAYFNS